ncbi:unnamed protein product [Cuscuta epithymum]|uniref:Uncharacterized protein n=1 Tax=Cuscuta epithymum TaxID=186058 RepID=A0AAV0CLG9_9ASTE|nr:unnamed protein product [Cuscuta epithymum]
MDLRGGRSHRAVRSVLGGPQGWGVILFFSKRRSFQSESRLVWYIKTHS